MFRKKGTGTPRELLKGIELTTLVHGEKTLMGKFTLARGTAIPAHSHPHEQTGFMVSGKLRFVVDGETMDVVAPGDVELASGAIGPHALDRAWKITENWVGIGFGIERLLMVADKSHNLSSVGRSITYLDGVRLNI